MRTLQELAADVRSIRLEIDALEANLRALAEASGEPSHTMADLHGILKGQSDTSKEEIDAAKFRAPDKIAG